MKRLLSLLLPVIALTPTTHADTLGFEVGATSWNSFAEGSIAAADTSIYNLQMEETDLQTATIIYGELEHPIPALPNIRLSYNDISHTGEGSWDHELVSEELAITSLIELNHYDVTAYYEVLDNWINLDLGLTARIYDGTLTVNLVDYNVSPSADLSTTLGLLFARARIDLPFTGLSIGGLINAGDTGDDSGTDIDLFVRYESPIGLGLCTGYRMLETDIESETRIAGTKHPVFAQLDVKGPYLSAFFHF